MHIDKFYVLAKVFVEYLYNLLIESDPLKSNDLELKIKRFFIDNLIPVLLFCGQFA